MVFSRINHKADYKEAQEVNESDWNHLSSVYKMEIEEKSVVVLLGKPNFELDKLIYFRIYLLSLDNMIEGQIGVFEIGDYGESAEERREVLAQLFDDDKDPNIHVFEEPLLFYFAKQLVEATATTSEAYLIAYNARVDKENEDQASSQGPPGGSPETPVIPADPSASDAPQPAGVTPKKAAAPVLFFLDRNAAQAKFPGEGQHERIQRDQMLDFRALIAQIKKYNWRKMLHDSWDEAPGSPFDVDGKKWKSVVHYVEACKFEKEHPEMYAKFALADDKPTNISKHVDLAISAASPSGVHQYNDSRRENILLRASEITLDRDYSRQECRAKALFAKFNQCAVLKTLLLGTRSAKLLVLRGGSDGGSDGDGDGEGAADLVEDTELMNLRDQRSLA